MRACVRVRARTHTHTTLDLEEARMSFIHALVGHLSMEPSVNSTIFKDLVNAGFIPSVQQIPKQGRKEHCMCGGS